MKDYLVFWIKQMLFWFAVFIFARLVFFVYYAGMLSSQGVTVGEVFSTFAHAWKLDLATACYLLIIPFFLTVVQMCTRRGWPLRAVFFYTVAMLTVYFMIIGGELGIYGEWHSKLDYRALFYLKHPMEVVQSAEGWQFWIIAFIVIASIVLWTFIYRRFRFKALPTMRWYVVVPYIPIMLVLLFGGLRGGPRQIPIHQSVAYFSQKEVLNDIAVNTAWNLLHNVTHGVGYIDKNPYIIMPQDEALQIVKALHAVEKDTTVSVISVERPNVVMIILESWSGDMIESIGGTAGITPNFKKLQQDGLMFSETYSGGKRSQQGLAGVFAGYPSLPYITACDFPEKARKLPTLPTVLNKNGYHTSFYFGGQTEYGNIGVLLLSCNFGRYTIDDDFKSDVPRGKLGVHDEVTLSTMLADLNKEPQPFFSAIFTVSSHSPFDQPLQNALDWNLPQMPFLNSVYYTDKCLGDYFEQARKQPWFENTLFILVADHGRVSHIERDYYSFEFIHVPMLFYGGALKPEFRGKSITHLTTQADIPTTLLKQLKIDASLFPWSKNILNPYTQNFVYCEELKGPGYKRPEGCFIYDFDNRTFRYKDLPAADSARIFREGTAYLQVLFQEFIDL